MDPDKDKVLRAMSNTNFGVEDNDEKEKCPPEVVLEFNKTLSPFALEELGDLLCEDMDNLMVFEKSKGRSIINLLIAKLRQKNKDPNWSCFKTDDELIFRA